MNYLKAEGETHLRPAMRRLVIWGMASPLVSFLAALTIGAIWSVDMNLAIYGLSCFTMLGSPIVVIWSIREFSEAKKEPHQFLNLFKTMFILNVLYLLYFVGVMGFVFFELSKD
jgi:hypothetical protein